MMLMITRRRRANKFLKFAAEKHKHIPELIAVFVIPQYDYRVLDFRYAIKLEEGGRGQFDISHDISKSMGEMMDFLHENEKKYPFLLDGMGADDRGWKGVEYYQECNYIPVFVRSKA